MAIQLNPLLAQGLANFAGQNMPNLNLQSTAVDVGAPQRGLAAGLLAKAQYDQKEKELAQTLIIAKLKEQEAMQREVLKAQAKLASTEMTAGATIRGQDVEAYTKGLDRKSREGIEGAKLGMEGQKFNLDAWYKQNQISQKDQELHQAELMNEFNVKFKMDERALEREKAIFTSFAQYASQVEDPAELEKGREIALKTLAAHGLNDAAERFKSIPLDYASSYAVGQSRLGDAASSLKKNPSLRDEYAKKIVDAELSPTSTLGVAQKATEDAYSGLATAERIEGVLSNLGDVFLGPTNAYFNKASKTKQGQLLEAELNSLVSSAKQIYQYGSQGFTDKDREFLQAQIGSVNMYKGTLQELMSRMKSIQKTVIANKWIEQYNIRAEGDKGRFERWLQQNPEPSVVVQTPDGGIGTIPASEMKQELRKTDDKGNRVYKVLDYKV